MKIKHQKEKLKMAELLYASIAQPLSPVPHLQTQVQLKKTESEMSLFLKAFSFWLLKRIETD